MGLAVTHTPSRVVSSRQVLSSSKILTNIFSRLDTKTLASCCQVSTKWYQCAVPFRWSKLQIDQPHELAALAHRFFPNQRSEQFDYILYLQNPRFVRYMSWVSTVTLNWNFANDFFPILFTARNLARLNLGYFNDPLDDDILLTMLRAFPRLRHLCLVECNAVADYNFFRISQSLPNLQRLELVHCDLLGANALTSVAQNHGRALRTLRWIRSNDRNAVVFPQEAWVHALSGMPNLRELDVRNFPITDALIEHVSHACSRLRAITLLALTGPTNPGLTQAAVEWIMRECEQIDAVKVENVTVVHGDRAQDHESLSGSWPVSVPSPTRQLTNDMPVSPPDTFDSAAADIGFQPLARLHPARGRPQASPSGMPIISVGNKP